VKHDLTTVKRHWTELRTHPDNPRVGNVDAIAESLRVNDQYKPIVTTVDGTILAGNHTYLAAVQNGQEIIACVVLDIDPNGEEARRIILADNRTADLGAYDDRRLLDLLDGLPDLEGTGWRDDDVDVLRALEGHGPIVPEPDPDRYTSAVGIPQYEPSSEEPPAPESLYDTSLTDALIEQIESTEGLDPEVARFLIAAAYRHTRFTYSDIAEFYAHADAKVQRLMEASALIILDVEDAIRLGYADVEGFLDAHIGTEDPGAVATRAAVLEAGGEVLV
jgi:hypothetical protein